MREEKNKAAPLPDYHKCGRMSPDRERVLLRAIQNGRAAKEQLQQHTVKLEDVATAQHEVNFFLQSFNSILRSQRFQDTLLAFSKSL